MPDSRLALIGAGRLATAMVRGILAKQAWPATAITCSSKGAQSAAKLAAETGISCAADLPALLAGADTVIVAFKPQSLAAADPRLAELTRGKLVISVLAGKTLDRLAQSFPHARNIVRTMPNTPAAIGAAITPYCARGPLDAGDRAVVEALLGALGQHVELEERHMDAVTALSAGGPAFLFEFVGALRDAGVAAGLPPTEARRLAIETVLGSARLLARDGRGPEELRDQVVSPNGTTAAGLKVMADRGFRATIKDVILASTHRAGELARE